MIIFQLSPPRTGSTWQFNTARQLIIHKQSDLISCYIDEIIDWPNFNWGRKGNILVKAHALDPAIVKDLAERFEVKLLFTVRNVLDSVLSARRVLRQNDRETISQNNSAFNTIQNLIAAGIPHHFTRIDLLKNDEDLFTETRLISNFLGLNNDEDVILKISSSLTKSAVRKLITSQLELGTVFTNVDKLTQWHGSHVSEESNLPDVELSRSRSNFKNRLEFNLRASEELVVNYKIDIDQLTNFVLPYEQQRDEALQQRDEALQQRDEALQQRDEALQQRDEALQQRDEISTSRIWRASKPIRWVAKLLKP